VLCVCYKNTLVTEEGIPNPVECLAPLMFVTACYRQRCNAVAGVVYSISGGLNGSVDVNCNI